MIKKILSKLDWYRRVIYSKLGVKRFYEINGFSISIDYMHRLPDYQKNHRDYDRFLPHLVKYLENDSLVIDIGANIGDTLAGMVGSNDKIEYLCIEAAKEFFDELEKNTENIKKQNTSLKIKIVKQLIGKDIDNVNLVGIGGTKHAVLGSGGIKSKSLFHILNDLNLKRERLALLKTDVDGFDWDVIRSSYELLSHNPYIFFECQYDNDEQLKNYKELFKELQVIGYSKFAFFDNYGNYICTLNDLDRAHELLSYIERQNFYKSTRTIYYYDVLVYSSNKVNETKQIIDEYNKNRI